MTGPRRWHVRRRDAPFLALVALTLACIGGFLATGSDSPAGPGGGWRRIDRDALERRIEAGDLSGREALWYRAVEPARR